LLIRSTRGELLNISKSKSQGIKPKENIKKAGRTNSCGIVEKTDQAKMGCKNPDALLILKPREKN